MDTIAKLKNAVIIDIIKVVLEDIILELHFNIECLNERLSFKLSIRDDGETVLFSVKKKWILIDEVDHEVFSAKKVTVKDSDLAKLFGNKIYNIQFGLGKALNTNINVIYYIKINTDKNDFLFFNNGDKGAYSFSNINEILENDIYDYEWVGIPPGW